MSLPKTSAYGTIMNNLPDVVIEIILQFLKLGDQVQLSSTNRYFCSMIRSKMKTLRWNSSNTLPVTFDGLEELILKKKWKSPARHVQCLKVPRLTINLSQLDVLKHVRPMDLTILLDHNVKYDLKTAEVLHPNISKLKLMISRKFLGDGVYLWLRNFYPTSLEVVTAPRRILSSDGVFHYIRHLGESLQELCVDGCLQVCDSDLRVKAPHLVIFKNGGERVMDVLQDFQRIRLE